MTAVWAAALAAGADPGSLPSPSLAREEVDAMLASIEEPDEMDPATADLRRALGV